MARLLRYASYEHWSHGRTDNMNEAIQIAIALVIIAWITSPVFAG